MKISRFFRSEAAFLIWASSCGFSPKTISLIRTLREALPSRRPQGRRNVKGFYSSTKMEISIWFESHTNEFPTIIELEYDPNTGEYYSQLGQLKLVYPDLNGRNIGCLYTPDLFVIRPDGAGWIECKTEENLRESTRVTRRLMRIHRLDARFISRELVPLP